MDDAIFQEIDEYWSDQKNGEIWLKNKNLTPGSPEYLNEIEAGRLRYNYYMPDILAFLNQAPGKRLLEVGCGMGMDSAYFAQRGFSVTGVDLARVHVHLAKEFFKLRGLSGEILQANAEELPFADASFDCAYSFGVLHHTRNPKKAIEDIRRVLVPGGRAVVMLYHKHSLNNLVHVLLRIPYDNVKDRRPFGKDANFVFRYSKSEVKSLFSGFSRVRVAVEYAYGAGWEPVTSLTPKPLYRLLSKTVGWHLVIYAEK